MEGPEFQEVTGGTRSCLPAEGWGQWLAWPWQVPVGVGARRDPLHAVAHCSPWCVDAGARGTFLPAARCLPCWPSRLQPRPRHESDPLGIWRCPTVAQAIGLGPVLAFREPRWVLLGVRGGERGGGEPGQTHPPGLLLTDLSLG